MPRREVGQTRLAGVERSLDQPKLCCAGKPLDPGLLAQRGGSIGPRDAWEGMRLRHRWPETEGALGLRFAASRGGRRQVSVSIWRDPDDLRHFVRSPEHLRIMREYRDAGALYTNAWTAGRFDRALIWRQAADRPAGRVEGVAHH